MIAQERIEELKAAAREFMGAATAALAADARNVWTGKHKLGARERMAAFDKYHEARAQLAAALSKD